MVYNKILAVFLLLLVGVVVGQEGGGEAGVCECGEITQLHQKCVQDWSALDAIRTTLEQQIRDNQSQCNGQLEQARGEAEQARNEGNRQLELARSESQAQLEQVQNEKQAHLNELNELRAQFEEQGNTHRRLQEASQQLEEALANVKAEKANLENSVREKDSALNELKKQKMATERDLEAVKKTLDEMIAARSIISIDWELLHEKIEELKAKAAEATKDLTAFCAEKFSFVKAKVLEFYKYLETKVYPKVKRTVEKDIIPFMKKSWKQAKAMWEDIYSPYRPTVNKNLELAKVESKKFYEQKLEPHVKAYELDVHAANARKQAEEYANLAHNKLVDGVKTGTKTALVYVKMEDGYYYSVAEEHLEYLHSEHELVAYYIECFFAFLVVYYLMKLLFFRKKKKVTKSVKKQQWKEKEAAMTKQQPGSGKKAAKNGMKNSKKNK